MFVHKGQLVIAIDANGRTFTGRAAEDTPMMYPTQTVRVEDGPPIDRAAATLGRAYAAITRLLLADDD